MKAKNTKWAGGAYKNQGADTTLTLPTGRYTVHYISVENNSFNNWTDDPPRTEFYGIKIYKVE